MELHQYAFQAEDRRLMSYKHVQYTRNCVNGRELNIWIEQANLVYKERYIP